jgi:hypothetical protein
MDKNYRIFGSSLTSLVLIDYLSRSSNCSVEWIIASKNRFGGHFAGVGVFNSPLDIGMVALEVDEPVKQQETISTDSPPKGSEINPFLSLIKNWFIKQKVVIRDIAVVTKYKDKIYPDLFISNDTTLLSKFNNKKKFKSEIMGKKSQENIHPRNKNKASFAHNMNLATYFQQVYGKTFFTQLVSQFVNKIDINLMNRVIISKHRSLWIPLFFPETIFGINQGSIGNNKFLRTFSCFQEDTVARWLQDITNSALNSNRVNVIKSSTDLERESFLKYIGVGDKDFVNVYSDDQKFIAKSTMSNLESVDIYVIYLKTSTELIDKVVFDTDLDNDFYRITSRFTKTRFGYNYICIETTKDLRENLKSSKNYSSLKEYVFLALGIIIEINGICIKTGRLNMMTHDYVQSLEKNSDEVSNFLIENNVINLSHNGLNNSMNEQILAALWYIDRIKCEGMV